MFQRSERAEWKNSKIIKRNFAEVVLILKQQPGQDILVSGSVFLFQTLMQKGLIDEYHFLMFPIVSGTRLVVDAATGALHPAFDFV